jgi:FMN-dependent oxidoreductase (nitrilotriacetate monooxygenase family)
MMARSAQEKMRLGLFVNPTGHHQAAWRHPSSDADASVNLQHYVQVAQMAEAAKLDAIFLADNQGMRGGPPEVVGRVAQYIAGFEPLTLLSALAPSTKHIGLIATASTTYNYPFQIARKFSSLDHLSNGRAGWNIVTSGTATREAENFGTAEHLEHELRYERASEFVEICRGLWDSWDDDAFVRDRERGIFSDMEKLHVLNHHGKFFDVRGPLNVPRCPQGYPLHVQAGTSSTGKDFAARFAEMMFVSAQALSNAQALYADVKGRVDKFDRHPDDVKIMPGLAITLGETESEAREKFEELQSLLSEEVALNMLSMRMNGADLSKFDLNKPFPKDIEISEASRSGFEVMVERSWRENLSIRSLAVKTAGSLAGLTVYGSAKQIADLMEDWFRNDGCDGFNLQPSTFPGGSDDIAKLLVPELQRRGLFRTEYEGRTLRENLGLPRPASRYA